MSVRELVVLGTASQAPTRSTHNGYLPFHLPNTHEPWPLRTAEVLELDDGLLAAAGFGDLARRPPDHVAFSDGVTATFGRAGTASRPRRS